MYDHGHIIGAALASGYGYALHSLAGGGTSLGFEAFCMLGASLLLDTCKMRRQSSSVQTRSIALRPAEN